MPSVSAGQMDRIVVLQTATKSQDEDGAEILTWGDDQLVWAEWLPAGTREAWQAQQRLTSYVDGVYRIYDRTPRPTPDASRIIGHDGRIFDVKPYIELGRNRWLEIPVVARGE